MHCSGYGNHFSTRGLQSHLLQSNNPACQDEFCKQNQAHLADIADEDVRMEIADDEEHIQAFGGNFFGSNYCPEDFEGFDCDDDASSSYSDSDSVDHEHDWKPEILLPVPSPEPEEEEEEEVGVGAQHRMQDFNCHPHVKFFNDTHGHRAGTSVPNQDTLPSHEQYKFNIGGSNIYALFKLELDWKTAQWAKMHTPFSPNTH